MNKAIFMVFVGLFSGLSVRADNFEFVINSANNDEDTLYVQERMLNGKIDDRTWISHQEVMQGGELNVLMGSNPNKRAIPQQDLPPASP